MPLSAINAPKQIPQEKFWDSSYVNKHPWTAAGGHLAENYQHLLPHFSQFHSSSQPSPEQNFVILPVLNPSGGQEGYLAIKFAHSVSGYQKREKLLIKNHGSNQKDSNQYPSYSYPWSNPNAEPREINNNHGRGYGHEGLQWLLQ